MPKRDRIYLAVDDSHGDEFDSTISKTFVLVPPTTLGPKTLVKMTGNRHDPNGDGTGNFSEVIQLKIVGPRKRFPRTDVDDLELDPKQIRFIRQLMTENKAFGTTEIFISRGAEDESSENAKRRFRNWKRRGCPSSEFSTQHLRGD